MDQNRSFCCDKSRLRVLKIPGGLDKSWETKRLHGLEMLGQSIELQKERSNQKSFCQENPTKKKSRHKKRHGNATMTPEPFRELHETDSNEISKLRTQEDYVLKLEYHFQELSRQIVVERQKNRQEKLYIARLQQDLARLKSERSFKEMLAKELEKEHRLRLEGEHRLSRLTVEYGSFKERMSSLENDLKKMTDLAQTLSIYKSKFEEQQHEGLSSGALNGGAVHSNDGEKTKVLLERLRRLEAEKTSLVLENENQSHSYEKCLDEITGQVLEALISQKSLKEECVKLQNRVISLQQQNIHLRKVFRQQFVFGSDAASSDSVAAVDGKAKPEPCCSFIRASLGSLNSVFSDQDQMSCLLSQMTSASIDLQDCLADYGAMADPKFNFSPGRDREAAAAMAYANLADEDKGGGGEAEAEDRCIVGVNRKQLLATENPEFVVEALKSSNQIPQQTSDWSQLFASTGFPLDAESRDGHTSENLSAAPKMLDNSAVLLLCRRERTNGEIMKQTTNEGLGELNFFDRKLSFDHNLDRDSAAVIDQQNTHLDTGSTVSLNELLDLAVADEDDEVVALTEIGQNHDDRAVPPESSAISDAGSDEFSADKLNILKDRRDILSFPEQKVLLPDVCPDYRSVKHL